MRRTGAALILTVLMVLASAFPVLAQTGWVRSGESWNYYKKDGTMASNQWIKSGDVLFWIQEDGTMAVNTWLESGDKKYWLDGSGAAVTGWQEIDGKWYYFQEDNTMGTDMTIDSYYVGKDGAWVVGK